MACRGGSVGGWWDTRECTGPGIPPRPRHTIPTVSAPSAARSPCMFDSVRVVHTGRPPARALVVGQFQGEKLDKQTLERDGAGALAAAAARADATGDLGRIVEAFPAGKGGAGRAMIVGLGERAKFKGDDLRRVA